MVKLFDSQIADKSNYAVLDLRLSAVTCRCPFKDVVTRHRIFARALLSA